MTTKITDHDLVWVILAIVAVFIVLPTFVMGFGLMGTGPMIGGMWGDHAWGTSGGAGWMLVIGVGMQLLFLTVIVGTVYLGYRAVTGEDESSDSAFEELRIAYARGDLSDDEYERRRERLETE